MKLVLIALSLFSVAALLVFCKQNKYTADNLPNNQIRFGKGGGFTGVEHAYTLLENGQIFNNSNNNALDTAKKRIAKACFEQVTQLNLGQLDFAHPGNTYSFIEVPTSDGFNRISWGAADAPVDSNIAKLHQKLMNLLPEAKN